MKRHIMLGILVGWVASFNVAAQELASPSGPVILSVSGKITHFNMGNEAHFDREMLLALEQRKTLTHTPWHDGQVRFEGPLGRSLLEAVGASGTSMRVVALDDYAATVPVADFLDHNVILAMSQDGKPLKVRDHGPLFIIYPFDEEPGLLNEETLTRSVWQVKAIEIR
ncbi:oxidoreductase [Litchfieldella qijiaojingensis]|uniref:Oxidoreductase n=1 Tax=Litchfieldella qijiaojingensis TaxID=980347 RepID=A0ABQ2YXC1_9GAMM|nr:molybdopterin-dependent oxidoreductase [Halomonas qijiaojingensis]GGX98435.1 oxidoreductase [Halomonas qijiaojingensis]